MHNYEAANRSLDKARKNNKAVHAAEALQQETCDKFERISKLAKQELNDFKVRRVAAFKKNFIDFVELQIKDAKVSLIASTEVGLTKWSYQNIKITKINLC